MATTIDRLMVIIEANTKRLQAGLKEFDKTLERTSKSTVPNLKKAFDNSFRAIENGLMSAGLSFLFTGMAIKRFFQTALNSMFQTFLNIEGETGIVNERIAELKALLEFVKFNFVDAFIETGLLDKWIDKIESIINKFNELDDETKAQIVNWAIWAVIGAGTMMVLGQTLLFTLGLIGAFRLLKGAVAAAGMAVKIFNIAFGTTLTLATASGILLVVGLFIALLFLIYKISQKLDGLGDTFKFFGIFVVWVLAHIGEAIIDHILLPFNLVIKTINLAIRAMKSLGFATGISEIAEIQGPNLVGRVEDFGRKFTQESMARKAARGEEDPLLGGLKEEMSKLTEEIKSATQPLVKVDVNGSVIAENDLQKTLQDNLELALAFRNGSTNI